MVLGRQDSPDGEGFGNIVTSPKADSNIDLKDVEDDCDRMP